LAIPPIDPWQSEHNLSFFLERYIEREELDAYIRHYVEDILHQTIYSRPSRGPHGEQGKDMVAIENKTMGEYCSYVVKKGHLSKNLDGQYGIIKEMNDAMKIPLEGKMFQNSLRTVIVVHNGNEGNRGALAKFEKCCGELEEEQKDVLLRKITRWDVAEIARQLFPHREKLKEMEEYRLAMERRARSEDVVVAVKDTLSKFQASSVGDPQLVTELVSELNQHIRNVEVPFGHYRKHE
jgi:hypothetical protein